MSTMPIYALVDTWNAGGTTFTAIKMDVTDTASAAGSLLLDLQVGGTSQFRVSKGGRITALGRATIDTLTIGLGGQTSVATNTALGVQALHSASLTGVQTVAVLPYRRVSQKFQRFPSFLASRAYGEILPDCLHRRG